MKRLALFVMMLAVSASAMAWGGLGHRTIAEIAERNLTAEAKANIERYTKGTPLAEYAVWMDKIRKDDEHHRIATRGWHASVVDENCKTSQEIRNKHRQGRDAVTGLIELERMLQEREKLSDSVVMFAIKCIVHMVGDMHCPAHLRYADNRNDGKFDITYFGKKSTLHKVWDTSVLTHEYKGWSYREYADKLNKLPKGKVKRLTKGWYEDWLEESGRLIRPSIAWAAEGAELDEEFQTKAFPLAEEMVVKSGYRLAKVLNTLFK